MGLFGGLPPAKRSAEKEDFQFTQRAGKAPRMSQHAGPAAPPPPPPEPSAADLEALDDDEGEGAAEDDAQQQLQQQQFQHQQQQGRAAAAEEDIPPPPPPPPPPAAASGQHGGQPDQVAAALRKIANHIGHPKKFAKASALLRELLAQGVIQQPHATLLFSVLKAAMAQPAQAAEPLLAREYSRLFTAASKVVEVFTTKERAQLEVFGTWAVLRNQLASTDDSFAFNKVVAQLKSMAGKLPPSDDDDEAVLQQLAARAGAPDPVLADYDARMQQQAQQQAQQQGAAPAAAAPAAAAVDAEADPFGLDALLEQQAAAEAAEAAARRRREEAAALAPPRSATWSAAEVVVQRRAALLDCVDAAKACYRNAWARVSVDLLIEHFYQHKDRFTPSQRQHIEELMAFVRDQRRLRKLGPSAKEVNRDSTSFERTRAEWSQATVSHRGKVGGGGDRGAEQWLGG